MDWSKAKTILIIALIITNIILGYSLYIDQRIVDETLSADFVDKVVAQLENRNIKIDTDIPRKNPEINSLSVEYEKIDIEDLNNTFFDGKGTINIKGKGLIEISYGDELISVINDKLIRYDSNGRQEKHDINSEEDAGNSCGFKQEKHPHSDINCHLLEKKMGYMIRIYKFYGINVWNPHCKY